MQGNQFLSAMKASLGAAPAEGPMVVPVPIDFTAQTSYILDITYIQQQARISMLQTLYIDNSANTQPLYLILSTTNQTVKIPANSEAYMPLVFSNKLAVTLATTGALVVYVAALNVAMNAAVWSTNNPPTTNGSGATIVSDPALEAGVASGYYQAQQFELASGGMIIPQVAGTRAVTGTLTTTAATTIFTGSPGFQLTNLQVFVSPNATLGTAGDITVTAAESTVGNIAQGAAFLATTAVTGLTAATPIINMTFEYTSKASATNLTLTLSAVPTAGTVYYNATYALTTFIGG